MAKKSAEIDWDIPIKSCTFFKRCYDIRFVITHPRKLAFSNGYYQEDYVLSLLDKRLSSKAPRAFHRFHSMETICGGQKFLSNGTLHNEDSVGRRIATFAESFCLIAVKSRRKFFSIDVT